MVAIPTITLGIIGYQLAGWAGAAVGMLVGAAIGFSMYPTEKAKGLKQYELETSSEGSVIPVVFGKHHLKGDIVYVNRYPMAPSGKKGDKKGGKIDKKSEKKGTQPDTYGADFIVAVCEAPAMLVRMWQGDYEIIPNETCLWTSSLVGTTDPDLLPYCLRQFGDESTTVYAQEYPTLYGYLDKTAPFALVMTGIFERYYLGNQTLPQIEFEVAGFSAMKHAWIIKDVADFNTYTAIVYNKLFVQGSDKTRINGIDLGDGCIKGELRNVQVIPVHKYAMKAARIYKEDYEEIEDPEPVPGEDYRETLNRWWYEWLLRFLNTNRNVTYEFSCYSTDPVYANMWVGQLYYGYDTPELKSVYFYLEWKYNRAPIKILDLNQPVLDPDETTNGMAVEVYNSNIKDILNQDYATLYKNFTGGFVGRSTGPPISVYDATGGHIPVDQIFLTIGCRSDPSSESYLYDPSRFRPGGGWFPWANYAGIDLGVLPGPSLIVQEFDAVVVGGFPRLKRDFKGSYRRLVVYFGNILSGYYTDRLLTSLTLCIPNVELEGPGRVTQITPPASPSEAAAGIRRDTKISGEYQMHVTGSGPSYWIRFPNRSRSAPDDVKYLGDGVFKATFDLTKIGPVGQVIMGLCGFFLLDVTPRSITTTPVIFRIDLIYDDVKPLCDCPPPAIIHDTLTSPIWGLGLPEALIDEESYEETLNYCLERIPPTEEYTRKAMDCMVLDSERACILGKTSFRIDPNNVLALYANVNDYETRKNAVVRILGRRIYDETFATDNLVAAAFRITKPLFKPIINIVNKNHDFSEGLSHWSFPASDYFDVSVIPIQNQVFDKACNLRKKQDITLTRWLIESETLSVSPGKHYMAIVFTAEIDPGEFFGGYNRNSLFLCIINSNNGQVIYTKEVLAFNRYEKPFTVTRLVVSDEVSLPSNVKIRLTTDTSGTLGIIDLKIYYLALIKGSPTTYVSSIENPGGVSVILGSRTRASDFIQKVLDTYHGMLVFSDNKIKFKVIDLNEAPKTHITMNDIVGEARVTLNVSSAEDIINRVEYSYTQKYIDSEDNKLKYKEATVIVDAADAVLDPNKIKSTSISSDFVMHPDWAEYLARFYLNYFRMSKYDVTFQIGLKYLDLEPGDVILFTYPPLNLYNQRLRIKSITEGNKPAVYEVTASHEESAKIPLISKTPALSPPPTEEVTPEYDLVAVPVERPSRLSTKPEIEIYVATGTRNGSVLVQASTDGYNYDTLGYVYTTPLALVNENIPLYDGVPLIDGATHSMTALSNRSQFYSVTQNEFLNYKSMYAYVVTKENDDYIDVDVEPIAVQSFVLVTESSFIYSGVIRNAYDYVVTAYPLLNHPYIAKLQGEPARYEYTSNQIGNTLYIRVVAPDGSDRYFRYKIKGVYYRPLPMYDVRVTQQNEYEITRSDSNVYILPYSKNWGAGVYVTQDNKPLTYGTDPDIDHYVIEMRFSTVLTTDTTTSTVYTIPLTTNSVLCDVDVFPVNKVNLSPIEAKTYKTLKVVRS
jgi:hypothetical protein